MAKHIPVLLSEVLNCFHGKKLYVFFDGTLGLGGHAKAILEAHPEIERYISCDQDENALKEAKILLEPWKEKMIFVHKNFSQVDEILKDNSMSCVDGFLCDIGISSMQVDEKERGFSFSKEGPLDMRMDQSKGISAKDVVNNYSEEELGKIFKELGEERHWRIIAKLIIEQRKLQPFETTSDLANLIHKNIKKSKKHLDSATLVFQALRIFVNRELEVLKTFLSKSIAVLCDKGIGAVISFHSLEDRIVKEFVKGSVVIDQITGKRTEKIKTLSKKPIVASEDEIEKNPRSRSAKLRYFERVGGAVC